mgnify:CR=1 FL=1|jgi:hypothetical protein
MGKSYELVIRRIEEVVDVKNYWFNNKKEAEEFFFQNKRIEDRKDFDRLYYVRERNDTTQTK